VKIGERLEVNYYQVLGITLKAKAEEIQPAYRKLVAEVYPGVNRGEEAANARMKEINRAYEVLRDPKKRSEYDLTLNPAAANPASRSSRQAPGGADGGASGPSAGMFGDAFNAMREQARANMTGGEPASRSTGGGAAGPIVDIWLTPREAVDGAVKPIKVDGKLIRLNIRIKR
jgi:molecular chaperone DnaJ